MGTDRITCYCSGPLFCPAEVRAMEIVARSLEREGYQTFLPHRDGLEAYVMGYTDSRLVNSMVPVFIANFISRAIFALDVYQIVDRCDCLVFNMNGRIPDEGGTVETAIAFATGKPVVIYKSDSRSLSSGLDCPMLLGTSALSVRVGEADEIPRAVRGAVRRLEEFGGQELRLPTALQKVVDSGRRIWKVMQAVRLLGSVIERGRRQE